MDNLSSYEQLLSHIGATSDLEPLTTAEVEQLDNEFPMLPPDYRRFLVEAGYGNLGGIQIYSGPVDSQSVYPTGDEKLRHILLFGDDMQGYCFGFDIHNGWKPVEVSPGGEVEADADSTFSDLLLSYLAES